MLTEEQLLDRDSLSNEEIKELRDHFRLTDNDLCDACDVTYSTFQVYLSNSNPPMPKKHHETLIHLFLRKYGYQEAAGGDTSANQDKGVAVDTPQPEPQKKEDPEPGPEAGKEEDSGSERRTSAEELKVDNGMAQVFGEEEETREYDHINSNFKHLAFSSILFTPKNGDLGPALEEAAQYSEETRVPVHVRSGKRTFKIETV